MFKTDSLDRYQDSQAQSGTTYLSTQLKGSLEECMQTHRNSALNISVATAQADVFEKSVIENRIK